MSNRVDITVAGTDQTGPAKQGIQSVREELEKTGAQVESTGRKTKSMTEQMGGDWLKLASAFTAGNLMTKGIELIIQGLEKLKDKITEMTLMAARAETLSTAMMVVGNNAGYSEKQMTAAEQSVRRMGIAVIETRESLTKMASAEMDVTRAAELARVAQDAAVVGNINSSEAFARMINGIRSGEVEILKTIGINVQFEQGYKKLAETIGKKTDQLSEAEKVQARMNSVLEYGTNIQGAYEAAMGETGKKLTSLKRLYDDLYIAAGAAFSPALGVAVDALTDALKALGSWMEQNKGAFKEFGDNLASIGNAVMNPIDSTFNAIFGAFNISEETSPEAMQRYKDTEKAYNEMMANKAEKRRLDAAAQAKAAQAEQAASAANVKASAAAATAEKARVAEKNKLTSDEYQLLLRDQERAVKTVEEMEKSMVDAMKDSRQDYFNTVSDEYQLLLRDQERAAKAALDAIAAEKKAREDLAATSFDNDMTAAGQIEDPYAREMAQMEARYQKEFALIEEQKKKALESGAAQETIINTLAELAAKKNLTEAARSAEAVKISEAEYSSKLAMMETYAGGAETLLSTLAAAQDNTSKSGFETAKYFNLGAATMSTAAGIMNQYSSGDPYTANFRAAIVAATGAIQIGTIQSTSFGGGGTVSAPAGSMAGGGGGGGGTGLGNLALPSVSVADSQVQDSSLLLAGALDDNSIAIGRMSKSIDDLTSLFEAGGSGMGLATNAPGVNIATESKANVGNDLLDNLLNAGGTAFDLGVILGLDPQGLIDGISSTVKAIGDGIFGGDWQTTGAGMSVAIQDGIIAIQDYVKQEKDGGLLHSDKKDISYTDNAAATTYMAALLQPFVNDIATMADTLNLSFDPAAYQAAAVRIETSGKTTEEIGEELSNLMLTTLQGMTLTIDGLGDVIGSYDDAYERLKAINDAWVGANEQLQLIGDTSLEQSVTVAQAMEASMNSIWGGLEGFQESMEAYREVMYTDSERATQDATAAAREMNTAWIGTLQDTYGEMPTTIAAFNDLRDSIDPTSALYQAVTEIGITFGETAAAAKELADANSSLTADLLDLLGRSAEALEITRALETDGLDPSTLAIQRQIYQVEDTDSALSALSASISAAETIAQETYDAAIALIDEQQAMGEAAAEAQAAYINEQISLQETLYEEQTSALETAFNAQLAVYETQEQAASDYVSQMQDVANTLQSAFDSLVAPDADTLMSRQAAQALINSYVTAGTLPMNGELDSALSVATQDGAGLFSNRTDYLRDAALTAISISTLNDRAQGQLTNAEAQLLAIQESSAAAQLAYDAQIELMTANNETAQASYEQQLAAATFASTAFDAQRAEAQAVYDAEIYRLDEIWANAEAQVEAAKGTTDAVVSVEEAIILLTAEITTLRSEQQSQAAAAVNASQKTAGILDEWRVNGLPATEAA